VTSWASWATRRGGGIISWRKRQRRSNISGVVISRQGDRRASGAISSVLATPSKDIEHIGIGKITSAASSVLSDINVGRAYHKAHMFFIRNKTRVAAHQQASNL